MAAPQRILPLKSVPVKQAPVKPMLTDKEKMFLDMLAVSFVKNMKLKSKTAATGSGTK